MAWISFAALPCREKTNLMTARVSMLLKSRASLTCFRACFLSWLGQGLISTPVRGWWNKILNIFINTLHSELNPICYLLALLAAHHILHVSRIRVKWIKAESEKSWVLHRGVFEHPELLWWDRALLRLRFGQK